MKNVSLLILLALVTLSCTKKKELYKEYYSNGIIKSVTEVIDGKRNGISKTYDETGRLISTAEFVNDTLEGWMINYNPANGKITAKASYKHDKQNGPVTLYYAEGQLYREETYVNGRVDGIVKTYWPDGKLQAEVEFDMGAPAIGLKEYDKNGNLIQQPHIVISEINQLALLNTFKLAISLSDKSVKVDYYTGELKDGKYLNPDAVKIRDVNGVATLQYNVLPRHSEMKRLFIAARKRTELGNTLILYKTYNLAITN